MAKALLLQAGEQGGGASWLLPRLIGQDRAFRPGTVEVVVPQSALLNRARELARRLAALSPASVQLARAALRMAPEAPLSAGLAYENGVNVLCSSAGDHPEGIRAFEEKCPAELVR